MFKNKLYDIWFLYYKIKMLTGLVSSNYQLCKFCDDYLKIKVNLNEDNFSKFATSEKQIF